MDRDVRSKRIKEIPKQIAALTEELDHLLLEEYPADHCEISLKIGDQVIITRKQSQTPGVQAEIVGETEKRYILKLMNGPIVYRAKHNVIPLQSKK